MFSVYSSLDHLCVLQKKHSKAGSFHSAGQHDMTFRTIFGHCMGVSLEGILIMVSAPKSINQIERCSWTTQQYLYSPKYF